MGPDNKGSSVDEPERRSGTCYLAGTRVPILIVESDGTLSTHRSGSYLAYNGRK